MARSQKRAVSIPEDIVSSWVLAPSPVRLADAGLEAVESPARLLQGELAASLEVSGDIDRWSGRKALAVLLVGSTVCWAVLIWGALVILR